MSIPENPENTEVLAQKTSPVEPAPLPEPTHQEESLPTSVAEDNLPDWLK